jgi:putative ABC transport system permease protein
MMTIGIAALGLVVVWFLNTDLGLSLRATGDNGPMVQSFGVSTDFTKTFTIALSNGFVGMCGALVGQYQGFADISMGIGLILVGLASVILGQAILGQRRVWMAVIAVIIGAILYRLIIFAALRVGLDPNDMKAITALLVVVALLLPKWKGLTGKFKRTPAVPAAAAAAPDSAGSDGATEPLAVGKDG